MIFKLNKITETLMNEEGVGNYPVLIYEFGLNDKEGTLKAAVFTLVAIQRLEQYQLGKSYNFTSEKT